MEELLDEMADISYKKACEKVAQVATEKAKEETKKAAIDRVIKFKEWRIAPERKGTDKEKSLIKKILEQVEEKLKGRLLPLGSTAGYLQPEIAEKLGLKAGIPESGIIRGTRRTRLRCTSRQGSLQEPEISSSTSAM